MMARMPNYFYSGAGGPGSFNPTPWAAAVSSLGQALFGDQAEIDRRNAAAADAAYRQAATEQLQLENQMKRDAAERAQAFRDRFAAWQTSKVPPVAPTAAPGAAPALAGIDTSLFTDTPVDFQQPTQFPSPVPPSGIQMAELPPLGSAPQATPISDATPGYLSNLAFVESRDNPTAQAPGSTASGKYQFINDTWRGLGQQGTAGAAPVAVQDQAATGLTDQNAAAFQQRFGRAPTDIELYMLHHFGTGAGPRVVDAPGSALMRDLVGDAAMQANSYRPDMTKQDFLERYMGEFGGQTWDGALPGSSDGQIMMASAQAPAPAMPTPQTAASSGIDAGMFNEPEAPPADPFTEMMNSLNLNPFEVALLKNSADPEATFNELLKARATEARKAAAEGGGLFGGTGIDAQMYNLYISLEQKAASGVPLTPQEQFEHEIAVRHLMQPKTSITEGGIQEVTPPALPKFQQPTTTPAPAETAPGVVPAAVESAPSGLQGRVTSVTKEKPLPADVAGKLAMAESGVNDLGKAINLFAPRADENDPASARSLDRVNIVNAIGPGMPWSQGLEAKQAMMRGIETIIRIASGAAVPDSEMERYAGMFIPSWNDSDSGAMAKLNAAEEWMTRMHDNLAQGRGNMSLEEIANAAGAPPTPAANTAPAASDATGADQRVRGTDDATGRGVYTDDGGATWFYEDTNEPWGQ